MKSCPTLFGMPSCRCLSLPRSPNTRKLPASRVSQNDGLMDHIGRDRASLVFGTFDVSLTRLMPHQVQESQCPFVPVAERLGDELVIALRG